MNVPPAGTMSGVDTGAAGIKGGNPSPERRLTPSYKARSTPNLFGQADVAVPKRG